METCFFFFFFSGGDSRLLQECEAWRVMQLLRLWFTLASVSQASSVNHHQLRLTQEMYAVFPLRVTAGLDLLGAILLLPSLAKVFFFVTKRVETATDHWLSDTDILHTDHKLWFFYSLDTDFANERISKGKEYPPLFLLWLSAKNPASIERLPAVEENKAEPCRGKHDISRVMGGRERCCGCIVVLGKECH